MPYAQYLRVFCRIESRLAAILSDIPFSPSRADQYSEQIQWGFPKFAAVIREVFHIDQRTLSFFHNPVIRYVPGDSSTVSLLTPFAAALFLFLSAVDPDHKILEQNGLLTTPPNDANCEVRSTLFRTQLIGT